MKSWDVIIVGGGIIGVSLALNLRKHGAEILIVEKAELGGEATHAAAGMLAHCEQEPALRAFALASADLYPEFVQDIQDESGLNVDYRTDGTILYLNGDEDEPFCDGAYRLDAASLAALEPDLSYPESGAAFLPEAWVDPRALIAAAAKSAKHRGIDIATGSPVIDIESTALGITGVRTSKTRYPGKVVVNCAGAWAGEIVGSIQIPARPIKGQMLALIPSTQLTAPATRPSLLHHVVHGPGAYIVPRSDGRIVIGATVEDVGFDKRIVPDTIQQLHQAAANLLPELGQARIHETWTGLRPASPDLLPILGPTTLDGYFVATGHFRDGILLAPITARVLTQIIRCETPDFDLAPFSPMRFTIRS